MLSQNYHFFFFLKNNVSILKQDGVVGEEHEVGGGGRWTVNPRFPGSKSPSSA